ncbi:conserved hypothetical protein [Ricinus communis]|uniref:Uncharacterized protein n=1 Tax=Ricinus communis TaxID=3988 RepID=B9SBM2_RICCO|nr:conserved hypothetical protein [Ricinus communis]
MILSFLNSIQNLTSLEKLRIEGSRAKSLPDQLQGLTVLKHLSLKMLTGLEALQGVGGQPFVSSVA